MVAGIACRLAEPLAAAVVGGEKPLSVYRQAGAVGIGHLSLARLGAALANSKHSRLSINVVGMAI